MCQTPIVIANRSRRFTDGVSPRYFHVACGLCYECRKRQQDDWFVRSFFEYQRVCKNGSVWFFTLTYDDAHLPYWIDKNYVDPLDESRYFIRPCFRSLDLKRFRDRLRVYLSRLGYDIKDIRFFISCELGGKYGRPHYHPLLFLPFKIPFHVLFSCIEKAWPLGRVGFSSRNGMLVTSVKAVSYCCKYVTKQPFWWRRFRLHDYLFHLVKDAKNGVDGADVLLSEFRRSYRLHFQSMRYGITGVDSINKTHLVNDRINLLECGLVPDSDLKSPEFAIPSYYRNKLLKVIDSFDTQRDNQLAVDVKAARFDELVSTLADSFVTYFDFTAFKHHYAPLNFSDVTARELYDGIRDCLASAAVPATPFSLAVYSLVYQGVNFATNNVDCWPIPSLGVTVHHLRYALTPKDCLGFLVSNSLKLYASRSIYERDVPDDKNHSRFDMDRNFFSAQIPSFSDLPCFRGYESFLVEVSNLETRLGRMLSDSSDKIDADVYNTALITGVIDNKYIFPFKNRIEL